MVFYLWLFGYAYDYYNVFALKGLYPKYNPFIFCDNVYLNRTRVRPWEIPGLVIVRAQEFHILLWYRHHRRDRILYLLSFDMR